jgi:negative elongation factor A
LSVNRTTPAGRKDGGVKFLEIEDQPLGYAAAKKRKRQQELEEQQKRTNESDQNLKSPELLNNSSLTSVTTTSVTPDYAAGLAHVVYSQPPTPKTLETTQSIATTISSVSDSSSTLIVTSNKKEFKKEGALLSPKRMKFEDDIEEVKAASPIKPEISPSKSIVINSKEGIAKSENKIVKVTRTLPTLITNTLPAKSIVLTSPTNSPSSYVTIKAVSASNNSHSALSHLNIPSNTIVRTVQYVTTQAQQQNIQTNPISIKSSPALTVQKPTLIAKTNASGKPTILSNIVLTPNIRVSTPSQSVSASGSTSYVISSPSNKIVQRVVVSSGQNLNIPTLSTRTGQSTIIQPLQQQATPTKIVQIKTTPTILGVAQNQTSSMQNIPPLISTQQPTLLNIQQSPRKSVTLATQQQSQTSQQAQQGQKVNQIIMPTGVVKGKTIIVSNQNQNLNLGPRNVILQSVGASGPIYQQIPLTSSVLRSIGDQNQQKTSVQIPALVPSTQNVPQLVISSGNQQNQQQQAVPRLITNITTVQPQQQSANHVQIRPLLATVPTQGGQLTLIQRPGQQAQLVQATQIVQPQTVQKTIIRPQMIQVQQNTQVQQNPQQISQLSGTVKVTTASTNSTGQRRGLSLSVIYLNFVF